MGPEAHPSAPQGQMASGSGVSSAPSRRSVSLACATERRLPLHEGGELIDGCSAVEGLPLRGTAAGCEVPGESAHATSSMSSWKGQSLSPHLGAGGSAWHASMPSVVPQSPPVEPWGSQASVGLFEGQVSFPPLV